MIRRQYRQSEQGPGTTPATKLHTQRHEFTRILAGRSHYQALNYSDTYRALALMNSFALYSCVFQHTCETTETDRTTAAHISQEQS